MKGHRDLRIVVAAAVLCLVGSLITPLGEPRIIFSAPLALLLTGYAVSAASLGRHRPGRMEMLPLSLGLSLATMALGSILLNYTPGGLRGGPWLIFMAIVVFAACAIAARRRGEPTGPPAPLSIPRPGPAATILSLAGLGLIVAALILAQATLHADRAIGFTELWLVPTDQTTGGVQIGVKSQQQHRLAYRLEVSFGDRTVPISRDFELAPGEAREISLPHAASAGPVPVQATLYVEIRPDAVYREVSGMLPATTSP